jgi:hypothetical protein
MYPLQAVVCHQQSPFNDDNALSVSSWLHTVVNSSCSVLNMVREGDVRVKGSVSGQGLTPS